MARLFFSIEYIAVCCKLTALKRRRKNRRHIQLLNRNILDRISDQTPYQNRDDHCKICDAVAEDLIRQERTELDLSQEKCQLSSA